LSARPGTPLDRELSRHGSGVVDSRECGDDWEIAQGRSLFASGGDELSRSRERAATRFLARPRLLDLLTELGPGRVGLVVAPAGCGKTTLLTQWAGQVDLPVVWHRAEAADTNVTRFATRLHHGVASVVREAGGRTPTPPGDLALDAVVRLLHAAESPLALVLDDLHVLDGSPSGARIEEFLLALPPTVAVVLGSRRRPDLNLARAELADAVVVTHEELRFRSWEVERLFREIYQAPLRPDAAAELARHTEGWAAALQLFHSATDGRAPAERRRAVTALAKRSRFAQAYLSGQVLAELPDELTDVLLRTSVFDTVTPTRCDQLLERGDSHRLLAELERRQALITSDDDGETFRYHEVLRRHLEGALHETFGADETRALYLRAADILEAQGAESEAIRARCRGEDWDGVRRLLHADGEWLADHSAPDWLDLLPQWLTDGDMWVALAEAQRLVADGRMASAQQVVRRVEREAGDPTALAAAREIGRLAIALTPGPEQPMRGWAGALRAATRSDPAAAAIEAAESGNDAGDLVSAIALLLAGDHRRGLPALHGCAESAEGYAGAAARAIDAVVHAIAGAGSLGRLDAVQVEAARSGFGWLARAVHGVVFATGVDPVDARACAEVAADCDRLGDQWGAAFILSVRALHGVAADAPDLALLETCAKRFEALGAPVFEAWIRSVQALSAVRCGARGAVDLARRAESLARRVEVPGALAIAHAALDVASGHAEATERADVAARSVGLLWRPWVAVRPAAVLPRLMPRPALVAEPPGEPTDPAPGGAPVVDLRLFGGFAISVDGQLADLSGIRPLARTALRLLALHGGVGLHRERLADLLWPGLPPSKAAHNLQVAIASVRAALQPDVAGRDSRVLVRDGDAYTIVLGAGSSSDLRTFDRLFEAARTAGAAGRVDDAAEALTEALTLYRGEVLPEDGSAEWVAAVRDRYRARAAEAAGMLAEVEIGRGRFAHAADAATISTGIDPWRDASWRLLIQAHEKAGDRAAATRAQRHYAEVLAALDVADVAVG